MVCNWENLPSSTPGLIKVSINSDFLFKNASLAASFQWDPFNNNEIAPWTSWWTKKKAERNKKSVNETISEYLRYYNLLKKKRKTWFSKKKEDGDRTFA